MRIIDAHMHLGEDLLFTTDDSEEVLLKTMDDHGITAQVVQPGIVARDQKKAHERIRRFAAANPGRCYGLACFNPLMDEAEYADLVRWTVKDLGFKGVKLHTNAFCMSPQHPAAQKIFRAAEELDIVVMIHTAPGCPTRFPRWSSRLRASCRGCASCSPTRAAGHSARMPSSPPRRAPTCTWRPRG